MTVEHVSDTRVIAGANVPDTPLIAAAIEYAQRISEPFLFNHAMRSWLFAEAIGAANGIDYDREVVAIGTILHDIGLTASVPGGNRFGFGVETVRAGDVERILAAFPRLWMKQRFTEICCRVVAATPETSYDNFLRDFGERFVPGYKAASTVDLLMNAPFDE